MEVFRTAEICKEGGDMNGLIVIKTDTVLPSNLPSDIVAATGCVVVILPLSCTITTKEEAIKQLQSYKEVLDRFL